MRSTAVFGRNIRYYDTGSGPTMALIHGIGGDADDWAFCLRPLSASHRVIALDLLGFGRSDKPVIDYSIAGFVKVLERFFRTLDIERATLIGGSLGGWIAAAFALQFPDMVDKLVLVDSAGVAEGAAELPVDLHLSTHAHMREVFEQLFYDKTLATDDLVDLAYQQHLERGDGYTIDSVLRNLHAGRERVDASIANLRMPVLLVWGEQDAMIPVETGRRLHQLMPGSSLQVIPECGHLPALEKPAEFVRSVLEFLAR
ncbi:MAG: alpha/beta fold hydrolase [Candidatus Korobacteraceae bacterium]